MQKLLYDLYAPKMLMVSMRYSKVKSEAEDILQEAFIKVYEKIRSFRGESTLGFWIKRIVVNTALNYHRSKLFLYPMVDVENLKEDHYSDISLSNYHLEELLAMIQDLPSGCQVIFNLYAIEGFKHNEIAKMMDISEGTSKSQYSRAKALLREKLIESEKMDYGKIR